MASMACSVYYTMLLGPQFSNDVWWAKYTPSGYQALLVDAFNLMLTTHRVGDVDLLATQFTMDKTYTTPVATTPVWPTYVRRLIRSELTSLDYAVTNLRTLNAYQSVWMFTQYCWVDLDQLFEIAHTEKRQQRCRDHYTTNGAVYMETVLRNLVWDDFMESYGGQGGMFTVAIQDWLEQTASGQRWLASTATARQTTTIQDEVALWRGYNIASFELQWLNYWQPGISETIVIQNALGMKQEIVLKNIPRTDEAWTSVVLFWMPFNDIYYMLMMNRSLVRSANNSIVHDADFSWPAQLGLTEAMGGQVALFMKTIGPFLSVDAFYVAVPDEVMVMYHTFALAIHSDQDTLKLLWTDFPSFTHDTTPSAWLRPDLVYYGGNPMYLFGTGQSYVQQSFEFYDACTQQPPLTPPAVPSRLDLALDIARQLETLATAIAPMVGPAHDAISRHGVGLMQMASDVQGRDWSVLRHGLFDDPAWSFYGWSMVYDWVEGKREVVSFQGDQATFTLMSAAHVAQKYPSSDGMIRSTTQVFFYLVVYVTTVLVFVAVGSFSWSMANRFPTNNSILFSFHRVVGAIWVGRPLLFMRGVTAVILLSTTQLSMAQSGSTSQFVFSPRPLIDTMVVAGEATWVMYVAIDVVSVVAQHLTKQYAPVSLVLGWVGLVCVEMAYPVLPVAAVDRQCTSKDMDQAVSCKSGHISIGSFTRVCVIFAVQGVAICLALVISHAGRCKPKRGEVPDDTSRLVLGIAEYFLDGPVERTSQLDVDYVTCFLAGYVPFSWRGRPYTIDIRLWVIERSEAKFSKTFRMPPQRTRTVGAGPFDSSTEFAVSFQSFFSKGVVVVGILNVILSIVGSVSYLQLIKVNLANDMFWANFNMTGGHAFIGNWLSEQLVLGLADGVYSMDAEPINAFGAFDHDAAVVQTISNVGNLLQHSVLNTIEASIEGLRATDASSVPWIFAPYCYVDFERRWELANTRARQKRCESMVSNGAVFLEGVLRNIKSSDFTQCWGSAFDMAIGNEVRRSQAGKTWLAATMNDSFALSTHEEGLFWRAKNILSYDTQWQNYKRIGVINSYTVTNVYGVSYPFTLQRQNTTYRWDKQTMFQMYWGLGNDLMAVSRNSSGIGGRSLVRSSPDYAFANTTMEVVLATNGTLKPPLGQIFSLVRDIFGPFGSIDMHYVPCPEEAKVAARGILTALRQALADSVDAQAAFDDISDPSSKFYPAPKSWIDADMYSVGGSVLCPEIPPMPVKTGMFYLMSWDSQCTNSAIFTITVPSRSDLLLAVLMSRTAGSTVEAIGSICALDYLYQPGCIEVVNQTSSFATKYMSTELSRLSALSSQAAAAIRRLDVSLIQFGVPNATSPVMLYRLAMLDPAEADFELFSWLFLVDWIQGLREAVKFEGDKTNITFMTEHIFPMKNPVNAAENPINFAVYMRNAVMYITGAMIIVASMLLVFGVLSQGHIEPFNLLELQRVGAIVWVGRPLLFIRSLTAIAMLSTATLQLRYTGHITHFQVVDIPWYKTMLAANEVTWLVAIVNDVALAYTQEYTYYYATHNSILVWVTTVVLSIHAPVTHSMAIAKRCQVAQVDAQIVCTSGDLVMGSVSRLVTLVVVVLVCNTFCYVVTRLRRPRKRRANLTVLYAGARYLFDQAHWIVDDVYFMDRMSAALNGILTIRVGDSILALDVKLWRTFCVDLAATAIVPKNHPRLHSYQLALPLTLSQGPGKVVLGDK